MSISLCPGNSNNKGVCTDDTMISLLDEGFAEVANNDDFCGTCSALTYTVPVAGVCQWYTLKQGCIGDSSCTGTASVIFRTS
jgi:hypothetical protein